MKAAKDIDSKKPPAATGRSPDQSLASEGMQLFKTSYLQKVLESNDRQKQRVKDLKERVTELEAALNTDVDRVAELELELDRKDQVIAQLTSAMKSVHVSLRRKDDGVKPLYDAEKDQLYEALCSTLHTPSDDEPSKRQTASKDDEEMEDD